LQAIDCSGTNDRKLRNRTETQKTDTR